MYKDIIIKKLLEELYENFSVQDLEKIVNDENYLKNIKEFLNIKNNQVN